MITLKDIEYNQYVWTKEYFKAIKEFIWAFKWDIDELISSHSLMYKEWTDITMWDKKVIDKQIWIRYWQAYSFRVDLKLDWLLAEFFNWEESYILLPKLVKTWNVISIKSETILKYFIKEMVKSWYLSDKYYLVVAPLLRSFPLWYNVNTHRIWWMKWSHG
jgi:hypothetical protein